jgi:hypothetical protein
VAVGREGEFAKAGRSVVISAMAVLAESCCPVRSAGHQSAHGRNAHNLRSTFIVDRVAVG